MRSERWRCQHWSAYVAAAADGGRRAARLARLALGVVVENDGETMEAIPAILEARWTPVPV